MPAAEGMVVATDTEDVRTARRMALELLLSDHAGECVAPCAAKCPAGLDIPGFVNGIATGDTRHAMQVIGDHLALPGSLGRICPRLCETGCRRCDLDQGLAIGALHRYVADQDRASAAPWLPPRAPATGKAVAIVGAGPAGLAAAWYLLPKGHVCTLFDAHPLPGGMLRYGIPAYRLPKDALDAEIAGIRSLGAHFRMSAAPMMPYSSPSARSTRRDCAARARSTRYPASRSWSRWPMALHRRWATMSWCSAVATPPWIAPAPRSAWARATCASSIAAAARRCPA
jgi:hypothetical protein